MLFNSIEFCIFFLAVFCVYYCARTGLQQILILISASFLFYGWNNPSLLILLIAFIGINATVCWFICQSTDNRQRVFLSCSCIVFDLLLLAGFKYAHLLASCLQKIGCHVGLNDTVFFATLEALPLPIGISFFTFEAISLLIETMRKPENNNGFKAYLTRIGLFFSFFPHLVAGPIVRPQQFLPQIGYKRFSDIHWKTVVENLVIGYFLKCVVADGLAELDSVFTYHELYSGANHIVTLVGYSARIFADFAGYSIIALGLASALGYELPLNFNSPYIAGSLSEFWKRWHITLSLWLKDYLYIPLGGNRKGRLHTYFNLIVVMFLGGLWHGGNWRYGIWGLYHGLGLALEKALGLDKPLLGKYTDGLKRLSVFVFITFGWLLFAVPLSVAPQYLKTMLERWDDPPTLKPILVVVCLSLPILLWHLSALRKTNILRAIPLRDFVLGLALFFIVVNAGTAKTFVYFQF